MDDLERDQGEVDEEEGVDRISDLEEPIKLKILSYLPIKDAIKTSKLSRKWRYTWTMISEFDIREAYFPSRKWQDGRSRMVKFVDNLLLARQGPIRKFRLLTKKCYPDALDRWILILSRNGISELTLELSSKRKYKIHSSFFACKGLSSINLCNCLIKLPQYFEGFKELLVLKLDNCSLTGSEIERFVQNCPFLKELSLRKFRERSGLRIDAPYLEKLSIVGNFTDLQLFTPRLAKACIDLEKNPSAEGSWLKGGPRSSFPRAFCGALCIRVLGIHRYFLQYLAQGNCREENQVPKFFSHLKALTLDVDLSNTEEIKAASVLFLNAPKLEDLDIIISNSSKEKCFPISVSEVLCLENLKNVSLECFSLSELTTSFLQAILRSSPRLQTLTISTDKIDYDKQAEVGKLYKSPRAPDVIITHL